jgi:hypothetical protein
MRDCSLLVSTERTLVEVCDQMLAETAVSGKKMHGFVPIYRVESRNFSVDLADDVRLR